MRKLHELSLGKGVAQVTLGQTCSTRSCRECSPKPTSQGTPASFRASLTRHFLKNNPSPLQQAMSLCHRLLLAPSLPFRAHITACSEMSACVTIPLVVTRSPLASSEGSMGSQAVPGP